MAVNFEEFVDAGIWTVFSALLGIIIVIVTAVAIPVIVDRLTPHMNERDEIKKGNQAVADYMGKIVMGATIGISLIIAAAIIAGIHGS